MSVSKRKSLLRKSMLQQRDALDTTYKAGYDQRICSRLWETIRTYKYAVIHAYLSMGSEIDLSPLITKLLTMGHTVICPKTLPNRTLQQLELTSLQQVEKGMWGTKHPASNAVYNGTYDLIIVPGLAFDQANRRLGYGGGYYDSFLNAHTSARTIGVAYPFQVLGTIPFEEHDAKLDTVYYE